MEKVHLGAKDEPSNPFKTTRKSPSDVKRNPRGGRQSGRGRKSSGPPAPPGNKSTAPPVAPSGNKSNSTNTSPAPSAPAKAGKSIGLRKQSAAAQTESQRKTDEKARQLIEATRVKATESQMAKEESFQKKKEPTNPFKKQNKPAPQQRKGGRHGKRNRPQGPSKRVKKLNQGKSMEFKYDMRRILEEEGVEDEHRSNVLSQTIAKGQRQGVEEAKSFLEEKVQDGIITDACYQRVSKLIDSLTTRR
jgi:hypothetical protein|tara:strand:+ start:104 stop:844 length:741 start_codon:yes stop_codon:yes gene_type:complete